jgi:hypothetical protein
MAAGESVFQTTNGEEDPGEEDDDWSDFASDGNNVSTSSHFNDQSEQKFLPSTDNTWAFDSVSETARLCFPLTSEPSSHGLLNGETSNSDLKENPALLEEHL